MSAFLRQVLPATVLMLVAVPCVARDLLSRGELAGLERQRREEERPVLECSPGALRMEAARGKVVTLRLTVRNGGGKTLHWSIRSAPAWARTEIRAGKLGYHENFYIVFTIDATNLLQGRNEGEIIVEAPDTAGGPLAVPIGVTVFEPPPPPPPPPEPPRPGFFGVRAGYAIPGSGGEFSFDGGLTFGLHYRPQRPFESRLSYELGLDYFTAVGGDGLNPSSVIAARFGLLWDIGKRQERVQGYLVSGVWGLRESVESGLGDYVFDNYAGALNLGAGLSLTPRATAARATHADVRATHLVLIGSENVSGVTFLTFSVWF